MAPVLTKYKVFTVTNSATTALADSSTYPYLFGTVETAAESSDALANKLIAEGFKKVAVISSDDDLGQSGSSALASALQAHGVSVSVQLVPDTAVDATSQRGFAGVRFHEHHRSDDGYLPSSVVLASAVAGRTRSLALRLSVIVLPLYDPIGLAEDLAVLDLASGGRVELVVAAGYVAAEFEIFGRDIADRLQLLEEGVNALRSAWTGEEFAFHDRRVKVRPRPHGGRQIPVMMGGSSARAARQTAHISDGFEPVPREFLAAYLTECERLGRRPGWYPAPGHGLLLMHPSRGSRRRLGADQAVRLV
jgi:Luciferase-like monooxygenase/Periplasmic binding protein